MKTKTSNDLRKTYSGIFGNQVILKNRRGKSVMTIQPVSPLRTPTQAQILARQQFRLAAAYGKRAMQDPALAEAYGKRTYTGQSIYRLAFRDFMNPPFISRIDASDYRGNPGDPVRVEAGDDFSVVSVKVTITDNAGNLVEEGPCTLSLPSGNYLYQATVAVPDTAGVTITATARDLPENTTTESITL